MSSPSQSPTSAAPTEAVDLPVGLRTPVYTVGSTTMPRHGLLQWYAFFVFMVIFTVIGVFLFAYRYVRQKKFIAEQALAAGVAGATAKVTPAAAAVAAKPTADGDAATEGKED